MSDFTITVNEVNLRATNPVGEHSGSVIKVFSEIQQPSTPNACPLLGHPLPPAQKCLLSSLSHPSSVQSDIPTPTKAVAYLLATCTPKQRTGLPPACTSSWPQRHKIACALRLVLESAFWLVFYHHCQLFRDSSFVLAHETRHWEDQTRMWQMKSSRKRPRVKACSVSTSSSFYVPFSLPHGGYVRHSCRNLCLVNTVQIIVTLPVLET